MIGESFSLEDLSRFIEQQIKGGLLNPSTGNARKYACELILGALPAEEQRDISRVDVEQAYQRFVNFSGTQVSLQTLETYKGRVERALIEMKEWKRAPERYEANARREAAHKMERNITVHRNTPLSNLAKIFTDGVYVDSGGFIPHSTPAPQKTPATLPAVPVPLRDNLVVQVLGLPVDLTKQEVQRILKVVEAYAV